MKKIRIIAVPPGFAPLQIRQDWVGVEIPLATEAEIAEDLPSGIGIGSSNKNGFLVLRTVAIEALQDAGKEEAVEFWASSPIGRYLQFKREVCKEFEN